MLRLRLRLLPLVLLLHALAWPRIIIIIIARDSVVVLTRRLPCLGCSRAVATGLLIASSGIVRNPGIMIVWLLFLCWIFLGVSLGADTFMTSIEVITSKEKKITKKDENGSSHVFHTRVW